MGEIWAYIATTAGAPMSKTLALAEGTARGGVFPPGHDEKLPKTGIIHIYTKFLMLLAKKKGMRMADRLISIGHIYREKKDNIDVWKMILQNLPKGINEIYCHPGYCDEILKEYANYVEERVKEKEVLQSAEFKKILCNSNINLISFNNI